MATKIRLQRFGRKKNAYYHIVVADSKAPRDGRYIERIGDYNPNTNPATINLNFERAVFWYGTGAQPTDTMKAILGYKGVLMRNHLNRGVAKGALTQEDADKKFENWMQTKVSKVDNKKDNLASAKADARKAALEAETKRKEATAAKIAAKLTETTNEEASETTEENTTSAEADTNSENATENTES